MVGLEKDEASVTFSVTCELVPSQYVQLVPRRDGGWDYTGAITLVESEEGGGADLSVWSCTLPLPTKDLFEYRYIVSNGTSFLNLSKILRISPQEPKLSIKDGNLGLLLDLEFPVDQSWLHSHTQLTFTLGYPDYYTNAPKYPSLGVKLPQTSPTVQTITTTLWNNDSVIFEKSHDISSPLTFNLPLPSSTFTHVQFDLQVGKVIVLSSQLVGGHGVITSPILTPTSSVIGSINFHFSIITPFFHPSFLGHPPARNAFPAKPILVGHRGSGAEWSRGLVNGSPRSHIRENTLLSFEKAGTLGAHFVEFDVHLTSDLVPVIFHDFTVPNSNIVVPIHGITLEEFQKIGSRVVKKTRSYTQLLEPAASITAKPQSTPQPIVDSFPTLRETLTRVPSYIGFNVEIKYPLKDEVDKHNLRPVDRNTYLDCILWEVFESAKDRQIVFSSFDPDICAILRHKQPKYPVMFLSDMGNRMRSDPRSNSPEASIHFAKSLGLQGLVCPTAVVLNHPDVVEKVTKAGMVLATWGRDNNTTSVVDKQLELGVSGIIVDHVAYIAKHWSTIFAK